jgi:hypothetical protein
MGLIDNFAGDAGKRLQWRTFLKNSHGRMVPSDTLLNA